MIDQRLIGTWMSDGKKTAAWAKQNHLSGHPRIKAWKGIRSPLYLAYTRACVHYLFRGEYDVAKYQVLAKDEVSNISTVEPCDLNQQRLWHTTFEGPRYWVMVGGVYREYFKKISEKNIIQRAGNTWRGTCASARRSVPQRKTRSTRTAILDESDHFERDDATWIARATKKLRAAKAAKRSSSLAPAAPPGS